MIKPEFIKYLETKNGKFYSFLVCYDPILIEKLDEKKLLILWSESEFENDKIIIMDRIYKTQHPFYIYINRSRDNKSDASVYIFYEAEQFKELTFFIKPFIKSIKK